MSYPQCISEDDFVKAPPGPKTQTIIDLTKEDSPTPTRKRRRRLKKIIKPKRFTIHST